MKKLFVQYSYYFIFIFILFSATSNLKVYTEISTGTVLFYTDHNPENSNIRISNKEGQELSLLSGLNLFPGDILESVDETLILFIEQKTLVIEVSPYSVLRFGIKKITSRDIVIQILVEQGTINITSHPKENLSQILYSIQQPSQIIIRNDDRESTPQKLGNIYINIISNNSEVITTNIRPTQGIFITKSGEDIEEIINTFNLIENRIAKNKQLLAFPNNEYSVNIDSKLQFQLFFPDIGTKQNVATTILMDINYKKFQTSLRIPLIFTNNNSIYSPFGENDYFSSFQLDNQEYRNKTSLSEKLELRIEHFMAFILTKINALSLATTQDNFYLYYGDQHNWKNNPNKLTNIQKTNSLLIHHYIPVNNFKNNLNKELIVNFNFFYFGNATRIRHFQAPSILDIWLTRMELFYNRFWVQPFPINYPLEIGFTTAVDGHTNKYNKQNTALKSINKNTNKQNYFFYGFDITLPIVLSSVFIINNTLEFGQLIPKISDDYIDTNEITNYGAKAGLDFLFTNDNNSFTTGISTNAYYTRGFFQPHLWFAGYEYSIRSRINTAITQLKADSGNKRFLNFIFTPEVEYFTETNDTYRLAIGATYPISINTAYKTTDTFVAPLLYFENSFLLKKIAGNIDIKFDFNYYNTFLSLNDFGTKITKNGITGELITQSNIIFNSNINITLFDTYFISTGIFLAPKYNETELEFTDNGSKYKTILIPFIDFHLSLSP